MKIKSRAVYLTIGVLLSTGFHSHAQSFRSWILNSTHIILAQNLGPGDNVPLNDYAITTDGYSVSVIKNIKGDLEELRVNFTTTQCMALAYDEPILIEEGTKNAPEPITHLVFLQEQGGTYYFLGIISDVKEADELFITTKISQMVEIQQIADTLTRFKKNIDWMVQCAANPHTRFALEDLFSFSNFINYHEQQGINYNRKDLLTADQKKFLLDQLQKTDLSWQDLYITDLLYDAYPVEITQAVVSSLNHLVENDFYFANNLMEWIIEVNPHPALKNILEDYENPAAENKRQKKLIRNFLKEYEKLGKTKK